MSECCETSEGETITVTVPVEIDHEIARQATQSWMAGDESQTIRDHLCDHVEINPVFHVDNEPIE